MLISDTGSYNTINVIKQTFLSQVDNSNKQAYKLRVIKSSDGKKIYIDAYMDSPNGSVNSNVTDYIFKIYKIFNYNLANCSETRFLDYIDTYTNDTTVVVPEELKTGEINIIEKNLLGNPFTISSLAFNETRGSTIANAIDIDQIDQPSGYIYRIIHGIYCYGTWPSQCVGNALLLIGFSSINPFEEYPNNLRFGTQVAFGFDTSSILYRHTNYNSAGNKQWGEWKLVPNYDYIRENILGLRNRYQGSSSWPGNTCRYTNIVKGYYHFTAVNNSLDKLIELYFRVVGSSGETPYFDYDHVSYIRGEEYISSFSWDLTTNYLDINFSESTYWKTRLDCMNNYNSDN